MINTFITADHHLGETRFELMGRPFSTKQQHINHLIAEHNMMVHKDDLVYMVGDVCYQKSPESLPLVEKFNGHKILFRGNHDRVFTDEQLKPYFDLIIPEGEGMDIEVEGIPCYVTHYPTQGKKDRFNLVGHIHSAFKYQLNCFNVGVDVNHFRPVNLNKIPFHYKAICEFYDDDVWVGYNEINSVYRGKRGKKGTYLQSFKDAVKA
jgi:calcineurin-like phosphoesterase family protein